MSTRKTQNAEQLAVRRSRALSLRLSGASYRDIAAELDVSLRRAYVDVQQELALLNPLKKATAERLRELEAARLDRWLRTLSTRIAAATDRPSSVSNPSLVSLINTAVNVATRRAKLLGLDAPTKVAQTDVGGRDVPMVRLSQRELDMRVEGMKTFAEEQRKKNAETVH